MKVQVNENRARQQKATNICEAHWYNALERPPAVNKLTSLPSIIESQLGEVVTVLLLQ